MHLASWAVESTPDVALKVPKVADRAMSRPFMRNPHSSGVVVRAYGFPRQSKYIFYHEYERIMASRKYKAHIAEMLGRCQKLGNNVVVAIKSY